MTVSRRRLIRLIFNFTVNAERYKNNILARFVQQLHNDKHQHGYLQHDGVTAHTILKTTDSPQDF